MLFTCICGEQEGRLQTRRPLSGKHSEVSLPALPLLARAMYTIFRISTKSLMLGPSYLHALQILQVIVIVLGYPLQVDGRTFLLKMSHA